MKDQAIMIIARYFGLNVEVLCQMESYSLIRFQGTEFVVETADLAISQALRQAA
jgi:hypothetical protein